MNDRPLGISELTPDDWRDFRTLRLEAFRTEPAAFSTTYAEARTRSDDSWRQLLANPRRIVLMATVGDTRAGLVGALLGSDEGDESVAIIFGMYVAKPFRGQGVGKRLLSSLLDRVSHCPEIRTVRLWVTDTQEPARRLYAANGFQVTGWDVAQMQSDGQLHDELIMERPVQHVTPEP